MKIEIGKKLPSKEGIRRQLEHGSGWQRSSKITPGSATDALLELLPEETIRTILRISRGIAHFTDRTKSYDELSMKDKFPKKDLEKIREILKGHQTEYITKNDKQIVKLKWLHKEDVDDIMSYIEVKINQSLKGLSTLLAIGKDQFKKKEMPTKPVDLPLNMAIYLLSNYLPATTKPPRWELITNFLLEQKIITVKALSGEKEEEKEGNFQAAQPNRVRDRHRKTNKDFLKKQYEAIRELYLYPERNVNRSRPFGLAKGIYQQRLLTRDVTLPPWDELIP